MTQKVYRSKILILTFAPVARSPRVLKQIELLSGRFDITTAGIGPAPAFDVEHIELDKAPIVRGSALRKLAYQTALVLRLYPLIRLLNARSAAASKQLSGGRWDLVIAHDVMTVPIAMRLDAHKGVLVDLHEYAPRQAEESTFWRWVVAPYFRWILRRYVRKAAAVTTVSQGIVDEYHREFGIEAHLVANATPFYELEPKPVSAPIRLVHSGSAAPARKIDVLIEAVKQSTGDVTLDLFLIDDGSRYLPRLRQLAEGCERIRFCDAVPYAELISVLNTYDAGISILAPVNFNHLWALPNKFFDYVQARLAVIVGPSPEMARIVREHKLGIVLDGFEATDLRRAIDALTPAAVATFKDQANRSARDLAAGAQVAVWDRLITGILESPVARAS